jgi:CheY-like chemotaxis protein
MVRALLELHGAQVQTAGSAREALEALAARRPDVILADIAMSEMDGCALLEHVRAREWPVRDVPAAALTAHASTEFAQAATRAGFQRFLAKPVAAAELTRCLAQLTGH